MKLSGFESSGKVELHASEDTLVVLKQRMTAMELLRAARSLQKLATDLHVHLARVCGHCDDMWDVSLINIVEQLRQELRKDFLLMIFLYIVMPIYY